MALSFAQRLFTPILASCLLFGSAAHAQEPARVLPEVVAETLNKTKVVLPRDLAGERNILMFSFGQDMQAAVDAWDAALTPLRNGTSVQVYNTPLIPNPGAIVRGFINSGMRSTYKDKDLRERVIVFYVEEKGYFPALGVTDKTAPLLVITDKAGRELGRVQAEVGDEALAKVRSILDNPSDAASEVF